MATINFPALNELFALRQTIKMAESRIATISDLALSEALQLAPTGGEFKADGHSFQLQRTEVIDMSDYHRYKDEDAVRWRKKKAEQDAARKKAAALTREMKGITEAFAADHPEWQPDEVKLVVKCIE